MTLRSLSTALSTAHRTRRTTELENVTIAARRITTITALLDPASTQAPQVLYRPGLPSGTAWTSHVY
jgi:hypothetical protein